MRIGILGAGNMAHALVSGWRQSGLSGASLAVSSPTPQRRKALAEEFGIEAFESNADCAAFADLLVLCVKPAEVANTLQSCSSGSAPDTLASFAAGLEATSLSNLLPWQDDIQVLRCMSNLNVASGQGLIGVYSNNPVPKPVRDQLTKLGRILPVAEEQLNLLTAVMGSGPAYFLYLADQLAQIMTQRGLAAQDAREVIAQTMQTATTMSSIDESMADIIGKISSKGGTTEAGLQVWHAHADVVQQIVAAAEQRAYVLAQSGKT